jgi:hypothetical protein
MGGKMLHRSMGRKIEMPLASVIVGCRMPAASEKYLQNSPLGVETCPSSLESMISESD